MTTPKIATISSDKLDPGLKQRTRGFVALD
jgi:hypothetical protein